MLNKLVLFSSASILLLAIGVTFSRVGKVSPEGDIYGINYPVGLIGSLLIPVAFGFSLSQTLNDLGNKTDDQPNEKQKKNESY